MRIHLLLLTAGSLAIAPCFADGTSTSSSDQAHIFGSDTQAWLNLQANGEAASKVERPLPGDVGSAVYQRYLRSFSTSIPEYFPREAFSSDGSGSK